VKAKEGNIAEGVCDSLKNLAASAQEQELVVPVVGLFSSGKSSLINSLLGNKVLPVAITPETSLAAELHYAPEEFVEAIKNDDSIIRYKVDEMPSLTKDAEKYVYAKVYLNNPQLKEIEPLVLVDMPGFDSPLDLHNKAIKAYMNRGCHYIVLSSVEEGTVSKSLLRRLQEIDDFGRSFSFFLTKADLRNKAEIDELVSYYHTTLYDNLDIDIPIIPLNSSSAIEVTNCLKKIDEDKIFFNMYSDSLSNICQSVIEGFNLQIRASQKSIDEINYTVKEMNDSIGNLEKQADSEIGNMKNRYSGGMINDIVSDVGRALENATDELVNVVIVGNLDETNRRINEIARTALISSVKRKLGDVNQHIIMDFSESLQGLDKVMKDLEIDSNYIKGLTEKLHAAFTKHQIGDLDQQFNVEYKMITGIIAAISSIINPIMEAIIILGPELIKIVKSIFGGENKQSQQYQAIRIKLQGEIFPKIKSKIRVELPTQLNEQVRMMIEQVRVQYVERIKEQRSEIEKSIETKKVSVAENETNRKNLENLRTEVQKLTNQVLNWRK
jgi:GTPase SAR1 family protein